MNEIMSAEMPIEDIQNTRGLYSEIKDSSGATIITPTEQDRFRFDRSPDSLEASRRVAGEGPPKGVIAFSSEDLGNPIEQGSKAETFTDSRMGAEVLPGKVSEPTVDEIASQALERKKNEDQKFEGLRVVPEHDTKRLPDAIDEQTASTADLADDWRSTENINNGIITTTEAQAIPGIIDNKNEQRGNMPPQTSIPEREQPLTKTVADPIIRPVEGAGTTIPPVVEIRSTVDQAPQPEIFAETGVTLNSELQPSNPTPEIIMGTNPVSELVGADGLIDPATGRAATEIPQAESQEVLPSITGIRSDVITAENPIEDPLIASEEPITQEVSSSSDGINFNEMNRDGANQIPVTDSQETQADFEGRLSEAGVREPGSIDFKAMEQESGALAVELGEGIDVTQEKFENLQDRIAREREEIMRSAQEVIDSASADIQRAEQKFRGAKIEFDKAEKEFDTIVQRNNPLLQRAHEIQRKHSVDPEGSLEKAV